MKISIMNKRKPLLLGKMGIIFALWVGFILVTGENLPAQSQKPGSVPELMAESMLYDAGEIWSGEKLSHAFVLQNKGAGDLEIKRVSPG